MHINKSRNAPPQHHFLTEKLSGMIGRAIFDAETGKRDSPLSHLFTVLVPRARRIPLDELQCLLDSCTTHGLKKIVNNTATNFRLPVVFASYLQHWSVTKV